MTADAGACVMQQLPQEYGLLVPVTVAVTAALQQKCRGMYTDNHMPPVLVRVRLRSCGGTRVLI